MNQPFQWSDAWILASVLQGGRDLRSIIATGDFLNHAIFTLPELNDGLGRLGSAGLIEQHDNQFHPTEAASRCYNRPKVRRAAPFNQINEILEELKSLAESGCAGTPSQFAPIRQAEYDEAVRAYQIGG